MTENNDVRVELLSKVYVVDAITINVDYVVAVLTRCFCMWNV